MIRAILLVSATVTSIRGLRASICFFAENVMAGRWHGKKAVWIAPEEVGGELTQFPDGYDHMRSIPVQLPGS
jgi:hypothetical protein